MQAAQNEATRRRVLRATVARPPHCSRPRPGPDCKPEPEEKGSAQGCQDPLLARGRLLPPPRAPPTPSLPSPSQTRCCGCLSAPPGRGRRSAGRGPPARQHLRYQGKASAPPGPLRPPRGAGRVLRTPVPPRPRPPAPGGGGTDGEDQPRGGREGHTGRRRSLKVTQGTAAAPSCSPALSKAWGDPSALDKG